MGKTEDNMQDVIYIVEQIMELSEEINIKRHQGIQVDQEVYKTIADSMEVVDEMVNVHINSQEWKDFYADMRTHVPGSDFEEYLLEWRDEINDRCQSLKNRYKVCNMCNKKVIYEPASNYFQTKQKQHGFPYWNAVFESISRENRTCPECKAMDRERMIALFLDMLEPEAGEKLKVLQIAPSFAMNNWLKEKDYVTYETTDLFMPDVTFQSDIQNMTMVEDETYDIILCSHILEHVENDRKAMRELKRILKEAGVCIFLVPLVIGLTKTDEEFGLSESENWKRFGQDDYARLYAKEDFLDRLTDEGYLVHILGADYFGEDIWSEAGLSDIHYLYVATKKDIGIGVAPYQKKRSEEELVSVIIPTYNRGYCIERSINSVLNQTWSNLEVLVVDDASTDNTFEIVKEVNDSRVRYFRIQNNMGANHARNEGIKNAKGNYIAFNDSDDEWLPEKLEKQMQLMKLQEKIEGDNIGAVYCIMTKYSNGRIYQIAPMLEEVGEHGIGNIYKYMQGNMFISTQTLVFRKKVLEKVGGFNEDLERLQDWELLLRVAQKYKFFLVQENLVNAYVQKDCISNNDIGWINTVLYVTKLHNMAQSNREAYLKLTEIILRIIGKATFPKTYVDEVLKQIELDAVYSKKSIARFRKILNESKKPGGDYNSQEDVLNLMRSLVQKIDSQNKLIQNLYANYNVRKGWNLDINKEKIDYAIEIDQSMGVTTEKRKKQIIVSLTSYPERMYDIKYTLFSLLHQSLKPDRVILWLAKEQFPRMESDIGSSLLELKKNGLEIMWCEDIKSYKKLIPALELFPKEIIVTADDDIYYPQNWLELLYNSYLENPECVHCHRAHKVQICDNKQFVTYNSWEKKVYMEEPSYSLFPTGSGGILYPPHLLYKDVLCRECFMRLCPNADDIWFWAMSLLNHTKIKIVKNGYREVKPVNYAREIGLCEEKTLTVTNTGKKAENDIWLENVLKEYPELLQILLLDNMLFDSNWSGSATYWENRYREGGTSGAGSYNRLADFKAKVINEFVREEGIKLVVEWGCGDGNQLRLAQYPQYIGFDVSSEAIKRCQSMFAGDMTKKFIWSGSEKFECDVEGDLALSLDVIYHLVEDEVFELYMQRLFKSSSKYVCIYSCNFDKMHARHVRCRKFTDYIKNNIYGWELVKVIKNQYPYDEKNPNNTSWSDFYIYKKN